MADTAQYMIAPNGTKVLKKYFGMPKAKLLDIQEAYKSGRILFLVDKSKARQVAYSWMMNKDRKRALVFWRCTYWVLFIGSIPLLFINWLISIALLIIALFFRVSNQQTEQKFVTERALEDTDFLAYSLMNEVIKLRKSSEQEEFTDK